MKRREYKQLQGGGGGSGTAAADQCPCECIGSGDLLLHGVETTSRWTIKIGTEVFRQEFGFIHFPGGEYGVIWDPVAEKWRFDIGSLLTSTYLDGSDATADTTMDGELTMEWDGYAAPMVKLCITGTVPDPE